jgi:AcrR family transcriptional regulator
MIIGRPVNLFGVTVMAGDSTEVSAYRKPEKVEAIIHAAYAAIARKGYARVSMRDIALEAGVTKSILHYYFKDKDQLIMEVFRFLHQRFMEIIKSAIDLPVGVEEKFARGFEGFLRLTEEEPEWFVVIMDLTMQVIQKPESREEVYSLYRDLRGVLAEGLREAERTGEIQGGFDEDVLVSIIIATVNGLAMQFVIDRDATDFFQAYLYFEKMLKSFIEMSVRAPMN